VAAGIALLAVLAGYHILLAQQGSSDPSMNWRIAFISAYITFFAVLAFVAAGCLISGRPAPARTLLMTTASAAISLGIPAIFSIGLALFMAAAVQLVAAARAPAHQRDSRARVTTLALLPLPPVVLIAGFMLTS